MCHKKSKSKIKIGSSAINSPRIKPTTIEYPTVTFSFKHLDLLNRKFSITQCKQPYFNKLLERLKNISSFKESELRNNHSHGLRSHAIEWSDTTEPDGFTHLNEQLRQIEAWQFEISSNAHGRVHGFLLDNIFYIVWFDPEHLLYR